MKKRLFILIVISLLSKLTVAQQHQYELVWNSFPESNEPTPEFQNLTLVNGFIDYTNGNMPSFSCLINLSSAKKNLKIVNSKIKTRPLSPSELIEANKLINVPNDITYNVQYSRAGNKHFASVTVPGVIKIEEGYKKITHINFDLESSNDISGSRLLAPRKTNETEKGLKFEQGKWFKFAILNTGPQLISYNTLLEQNIISGSTTSDQIKIYGSSANMLPFLNNEIRHPSLAEIKISIDDGNDGSFDSGDNLIFYGEAGSIQHYDAASQLLLNTTQYYSDSNFVFITINSSDPERIQDVDNSSLLPISSLINHNQVHHHENDWVNFIKSGRTWVGEDFQTQNPLKFTIESPSVGNLTLNFTACARSTNYSENKISVITNGDTIATVIIPIVSSVYYNDYVKFINDQLTFIHSGTSNTIEFYYHNSDPTSLAWLDHFTLNNASPITLNSEKHERIFNKEGGVTPGVYEYIFTSNVTKTLVWDVSQYNNVKNITPTVLGNQYAFKADAGTSNDFIAFTTSHCFSPVYIKQMEGQELDYNDVPEMLIVSHPLFMEEAQRLADFHSNQDNLKTRVVNTTHIYNHKSSGRKEAGAIRDYIKYLYENPTSSDSLKYVLLFGSGSYDPKNRLDNNKDYVPTYQSANSVKLTSSYVTDDFYGVLDENEGDFKNNDKLDISIGRLPTKTKDEAKVAVDKILQYYNQYDSFQDNGEAYSSEGSWQNKVVFVADDGDSHEHMKQAEALSTIVDTSLGNLNISKIYVDAFLKESLPGSTTAKEVNKQINRNITDGALLVNYTGHGGEFGWGSERFLSIQDILGLKNKTTLPLLMTATCEFSRFDDPARRSAGELMFLQQDGGAIALFTTVRLVFSIPNFNLNRNFYYVLIEEQNNESLRIGDLFRKTKIKNNAGTNDRNFTLLGDPALLLSIPKKNVLVDSIIAWGTSRVDTLKALTQGTIHGHIENNSGIKQNDFDGTVEIKIFDKQIPKETLNNNNYPSAFNYNTRSSLLFKTLVSVNKGEFMADIIIPKNILSNFDYSKISFFALSKNDNGKGSNKKILIGGIDESAPEDLDGPEIQVFINDSTFIFGDHVPPSPYFIAKLSDESGINITSNNIANNLILTLNKSPEYEYVLNEQYQTDLNTYKTGSIVYQLNDITSGSHTLEFQASDNQNNSSKFYTEFIIEEDANLALEHVLNYPNPFTTNTGFYFEQNQIKHSNIEVLIQIYTITGKIVKTIRENISADKKLIGPIDWDGRDEYGDAIGRGVYLYRIKVSAENGTKAEQIEKLVILK